MGPIRICYVSPEYFHWGYHGGFGFLTRTLSRELAKRGHEVSVVTPRRGTQGELEVLDGVTVYGFTPNKDGPHIFGPVLSRLASLECYKQVDADIYHSQAVSYNTLTAQMCMPHKLHMITFQDPYDLNEWNRISKVDSRYRLTPRFKVRLAVENRLLSHACSRANALYSQAHFLKLKSRQLFSLPRDPAFLPNPVKVPTRRMKKADEPTLCFLARWDPQKRVELFLGLASSYPDIHFIAMGNAHDPVTDRRLRIEYRGQANLELTDRGGKVPDPEEELGSSKHKYPRGTAHLFPRGPSP